MPQVPSPAALAKAAFDAAANGQLELLRLLLLACPAAVHHAFLDSRMTALHAAALLRRAETSLALLAAGADPSTPAQLGAQPLHMAAFGGCHEVGRLLLDAGAGVDARDASQHTPLHSTADDLVLSTPEERADFARLLLDRGASVDARNVAGDTPLHVAARTGCVAVVRVMLERGASWSARNDAGDTPMDVCRGRCRQPRDPESNEVYAALLGIPPALPFEPVCV